MLSLGNRDLFLGLFDLFFVDVHFDVAEPPACKFGSDHLDEVF